MLISRAISIENAFFAGFRSMSTTSYGGQRFAFATDPQTKLSFGNQRKKVNLEEDAPETTRTQSACLQASLVVILEKQTVLYTNLKTQRK